MNYVLQPAARQRQLSAARGKTRSHGLSNVSPRRSPDRLARGTGGLPTGRLIALRCCHACRPPTPPQKKAAPSESAQKAWDDLRREVRLAPLGWRRRGRPLDPLLAAPWAVHSANLFQLWLHILDFACKTCSIACCAGSVGSYMQQYTSRWPIQPLLKRHPHPTEPASPALSRSLHMSQARKLESELDIKIAAFGKLCSGFEYGYSKGESGMATDQVRPDHSHACIVAGAGCMVQCGRWPHFKATWVDPTCMAVASAVALPQHVARPQYCSWYAPHAAGCLFHVLRWHCMHVRLGRPCHHVLASHWACCASGELLVYATCPGRPRACSACCHPLEPCKPGSVLLCCLCMLLLRIHCSPS